MNGVLVGTAERTYYCRATQLPPAAAEDRGEQRRRVLTASVVVTGLMLLTLLANILGF